MTSEYEWLNLIEVSGPFLSEPVLRQTLPDGLDVLGKGVAPRLRSAYDEWREAVDDADPRLNQLHSAWINEVLTQVLDCDDNSLLRGDRLPERVSVDLPEHGTTLRPDMAFVEPVRPETPLMLVLVVDPDTDLDASVRCDGFVASPKERMLALLKGTGCRLGLVTNGEAWTLVHASQGAVASNATWYARMFGLERETLRAFASLLGIRRLTGPSSERLTALFDRSVQHQGDVTDALGDQVAEAIELLMRALDRADQDRNRELLKDVAPKTLYEAGLTLMMRLVVILSAEERDLLLLGDPIYDANYAIASMRSQLVAMDPAVLATREEAWSRLLATFRLVYAGSDHPDLRLPALGGSLFDPDRFPFFEGRQTGSKWNVDPAAPLPIDDRTVLVLLDAIQTFRGRTLSYKSLDVEQIGHVYEGLLDQTAGRVAGVTLQLKGSSKARTPLVSLADLETARELGPDALVHLLVEKTERSETAVRSDLTSIPEKDDVGRLLTSCRGDAELRDRILPFVRFLAYDPWGMPLVHQAGAIVIVKGTDRRESGSHYTPKSLTEKIVEETLTPVVYQGPAEGAARKDWQLKSPAELLDLKICDPAMGSGAFLVQVCRWLGDRLVEAWAASEAKGRLIDAGGVAHDTPESMRDPMVADTESRIVEARRLIAERCIYGVDLNPLAVELAKLSLWLTTVAKRRPFGFLDHNLRFGDSLLGITDLNQVIELDMIALQPEQLRLFGRSIGEAVEGAISLRRELRAHPVRDIKDVKAMARLDAESRNKLVFPNLIADAFVGCVLAEKKGRALENGLVNIAALADAAASGNQDALDALIRAAKLDLSKDEPQERARKPFHWPLEFPEVFVRKNGGFDAFVGNPPFVGGFRISGSMGDAYRDWLVSALADGRKGAADLVAYFFLSASKKLRNGGLFGLLATNTIAEGDTRQVGLESLLKAGLEIISAYPSEKWPGAAAVATSRVHAIKGKWAGTRVLSGKKVHHISAFLTEGEQWSPKRLAANENIAFIGSYAHGDGFIINEADAKQMLIDEPNYSEVLFPYLNGKDLNSDPAQKSSRWIINFWDWSEDKASTFLRPFQIVQELVKPYRQEVNADGIYKLDMYLAEKWWQFKRATPALYHTVGRDFHFVSHPVGWKGKEKLDYVLVVPRVSKFLVCSICRNNAVFSDATVVFASNKYEHFSVIQSTVHEVWARQQASTLETRLRYTPSDVFETFAMPTGDNDIRLAELGLQYHAARQDYMHSNLIGLTNLYNRFHDPEKFDKSIQKIRELHKEIDQSLVDAYGWSDIGLGHGFHEVTTLPENDRVRFTFSEAARCEILNRLAELGRKRFQDQVDKGLHFDSMIERKSKQGESKKFTPEAVKPSIGLNIPEPTQKPSNEKKDALLAFLRARPGRHGRSNLFGVRRMSSGEFVSTMGELISEGLVIQTGTAPNETYVISERGKNG